MASHLTVSQYRTLTGQALVGVNDTYVDYKLSQWSKRLDQMTNQNWSDLGLATLTKDVINCSNKKYYFKAFQELDIQIYIRNKKTSNWTLLVPNLDFKFIYPKFDSFNNYNLLPKPVVGLDFTCYKCLCECNELKIVGKQYWSLLYPDDLLDILTNLLENLLGIEPKAYTDGNIPIKNQVNDIRSETDQTRSVTWFVDENRIKDARLKNEQGVEFKSFNSVIMRYALAGTKLYDRYSV